jgi:hypothetical protein
MLIDNIYWCVFCIFGVHLLRSQFGKMVPPNWPKITVDPSVLEDFLAFQAYKAAQDALEAASTATGTGGGGEVVLTPKATSAPKKKNPPPRSLPKCNAKSKMLAGKEKKGKKADPLSEPLSDSGEEEPPVRGGVIRNLGLLRMPPGTSSGAAGLVPTVDEVPWDAHIWAPMADAPDRVSIHGDLPPNLCRLLLSFMKYPMEAPMHDGNGEELLSEVNYKDLAVELECMTRRSMAACTHTAGRAVSPWLRMQVAALLPAKIHRDGFMLAGPMFASDEIQAEFEAFFEQESTRKLEKVLHLVNMWHAV